jgi:hypothetical protein
MSVGYRQRLLKANRFFDPLLFKCDHRISGLTTCLVIGVTPLGRRMEHHYLSTSASTTATTKTL